MSDSTKKLRQSLIRYEKKSIFKNNEPSVYCTSGGNMLTISLFQQFHSCGIQANQNE